MEVVNSSETLVNTSIITWCINPEDQYLKKNIEFHKHARWQEIRKCKGGVANGGTPNFIKIYKLFQKLLGRNRHMDMHNIY